MTDQLANRYKLKFIDPDFRHDPKTDWYCARCQKDLKPDQPFRTIHLVAGGPFALHPSEEERYQAEFGNAQDPGDLGCFPVGMECARKIGLEWTHK